MGIKSIKWRLTLMFFSVTAVFLFLLGLYITSSMEKYTYAATESKLVFYARLIADDLKDRSLNNNVDTNYLRKYVQNLNNDIKARVAIIDNEGTILIEEPGKRSLANQAVYSEVKDALGGSTGIKARYSGELREKMLYVAVPVMTNNVVKGVVRVAVPWSDIEAGKNHIRLTISTAIIVALILMVLVSSSFTSGLIIPLQHMTKVAKEMAEGRLDTNVDIVSDDEIGELGRGLNYMAQRLRDTIRQITEERNKIKAILTSMNDGVIAVDKKGHILLINPAVEKMFNIKYESSLGKPVIEVIRNIELERLLKRVLDNRESINQELQLFAPGPRTFRISTAPLTNESGAVGAVAVMRDISAFKEVERMKTDFVANVSHELRTPMTSIKGFIETLLDGALEDPETARHFLEIINDEADRLNRLISDLLSLSQIEAKRQEVHFKFLDLGKIINSTVSVLSPLASEKSLKIDVSLEPDLPCIEGDEDMVGQLLINLIDNAIKYTQGGGKIGIKAERLENEIKVSVSDTGIGIPRDCIPRLFERFYRVDKARSREMGGTGLGLAIVKHILEVHSGRIEVDSLIGKGSTFTFFLPIKNL